MTKERIIAAIQECFDKLGRTPTARDLLNHSGITKRMVAREFGTYTRGLAACGLARQDHARPHTMMELFEIWAAVARKVQKVPTIADFKIEGGVSEGCLIRRFHKWQLVPLGMRKFMAEHKLDGEWADVAEIIGKHASAPANAQPLTRAMMQLSRPRPTSVPMAMPMPELSKELMPDRPRYGAPISHPAMANAPVNEAGVAVLFGAMAAQLGFIILRMQSAFPDGEALRLMKDGSCQRVIFEMEYESKNFQIHMHDATKCDLIVCWVHNWKDCPVEVIELSKFFRS